MASHRLFNQFEAYEQVIRLRNQWTSLAAFTAPPFHEQSFYYLRYGAAKRIRWISKDLEWLLNFCPESRTKTLSGEECDQAGLHLNSLYLHIRGALDNFAWSLLWQISSNDAEKIESEGKYMSVGLYTPTLTKLLQPEARKLVHAIEKSRGWDKTLRSKRDPVAHRLPLRVIPQVLNQEQAHQYQELNFKANQAMEEFSEKCQRAEELRDGDDSIEALVAHCEAVKQFGIEKKVKQQDLHRQMSELGTFSPYFANSGETMPLYPTIVDDCKELAQISEQIIVFLKSQTIE